MTDYPDAIWTRSQLIDHLEKIACLLQSDVFNRSIRSTLQSQARWIELIRAVSDLVRQASLAGKRIDFTDEVSVQGKERDITSLLDAMRQHAHVVHPIMPGQGGLRVLSPAFNQFNGVGYGQFGNGLFYRCPHNGERAFFIGQDRIYFYRHLMRAYMEAGDYLTSLSCPE